MDQVGQAYAMARVGLGAAQVAFPGLARRRLGLPADAVGRFDQRAVGVRDAVLGAGVLAGRLRGSARHWYTACAIVDAVDGLAFVALGMGGHVGKGRALLGMVLGLASAATAAALAVDAAGGEPVLGHAPGAGSSSPAGHDPVEYGPAG
jgi:hypothetical protein